MKRRWAWNIFCVFSLVIFATSVTLWVRSYFVADYAMWTPYAWTDATGMPIPNGGSSYIVGYRRGAVGIFRDAGNFYSRPSGWRHWSRAPTNGEFYSATPSDRLNLHFGSFRIWYKVEAYSNGWASWRCVVLPFWLFLIFAVPPLLWWRKRRKRLGGRGFPVAAATDKAM